MFLIGVAFIIIKVLHQQLFRPDYHNTVHSFPINGSELSDYKSSIAKPKLNDGDVILFPPYVEHCVDENLSDDIRITFSFNLFIPQ